MTARILIVDDAAVNRLVLRHMLGAGPWELRFAEDGRGAVAAFEDERPALVLMDLAMPAMTGVEAARRMRMAEAAGARARVGIVAITASLDPATHASALAAGFDAVVTKPVAKDAILAIARAAVPARTAAAPVDRTVAAPPFAAHTAWRAREMQHSSS